MRRGHYFGEGGCADSPPHVKSNRDLHLQQTPLRNEPPTTTKGNIMDKLNKDVMISNHIFFKILKYNFYRDMSLCVCLIKFIRQKTFKENISKNIF